MRLAAELAASIALAEAPANATIRREAEAQMQARTEARARVAQAAEAELKARNTAPQPDGRDKTRQSSLPKDDQARAVPKKQSNLDPLTTETAPSPRTGLKPLLLADPDAQAHRELRRLDRIAPAAENAPEPSAKEAVSLDGTGQNSSLSVSNDATANTDARKSSDKIEAKIQAELQGVPPDKRAKYETLLRNKAGLPVGGDRGSKEVSEKPEEGIMTKDRLIDRKLTEKKTGGEGLEGIIGKDTSSDADNPATGETNEGQAEPENKSDTPDPPQTVNPVSTKAAEARSRSDAKSVSAPPLKKSPTDSQTELQDATLDSKTVARIQRKLEQVPPEKRAKYEKLFRAKALEEVRAKGRRTAEVDQVENSSSGIESGGTEAPILGTPSENGKLTRSSDVPERVEEDTSAGNNIALPPMRSEFEAAEPVASKEAPLDEKTEKRIQRKLGQIPEAKREKYAKIFRQKALEDLANSASLRREPIVGAECETTSSTLTGPDTNGSLEASNKALKEDNVGAIMTSDEGRRLQDRKALEAAKMRRREEQQRSISTSRSIGLDRPVHNSAEDERPPQRPRPVPLQTSPPSLPSNLAPVAEPSDIVPNSSTLPLTPTPISRSVRSDRDRVLPTDGPESHIPEKNETQDVQRARAALRRASNATDQSVTSATRRRRSSAEDVIPFASLATRGRRSTTPEGEPRSAPGRWIGEPKGDQNACIGQSDGREVDEPDRGTQSTREESGQGEQLIERAETDPFRRSTTPSEGPREPDLDMGTAPSLPKVVKEAERSASSSSARPSEKHKRYTPEQLDKMPEEKRLQYERYLAERSRPDRERPARLEKESVKRTAEIPRYTAEQMANWSSDKKARYEALLAKRRAATPLQPPSDESMHGPASNPQT